MDGPEKAAIEDPDFSPRKYVAKGLGFQAAAVGNNKFYSSKFNGGLPGQGWTVQILKLKF